eukprot:PhF_6_TR7868/c1_g1_i8/m.11511
MWRFGNHDLFFIVMSIVWFDIVLGYSTYGTTPMNINNYQVFIHNYQTTYSCATNPGSMDPSTVFVCENAVPTCAAAYYFGVPTANTNAAGSDMCFYGVLYLIGAQTYPSNTQNGVTTNAYFILCIKRMFSVANFTPGLFSLYLCESLLY